MYYVIIVLIGLSTLGYFWVKKKYSYWESHGVASVPPTFPYGNLKGVMDTVHLYVMIQNLYKQLKGKGLFGGIYFLLSPSVLVTDLEFIKRILIKDFNHFEDRGVYYNEKDDPLSAHLFSVNGTLWRKLRSKLTPTFTSGKMKFMYPTILDVAERFRVHINGLLEGNSAKTLEVRDLLGRFSTDVIGTCAFGIECNNINDPNSQFMSMGRKTFTEPRHAPLPAFLIQSYSNISRAFGIKNVRDDVSDFFMKIVVDNAEFREKNNINRNDFMDILLKLKNNIDDKSTQLSLNEIAAQAFVFFLAGFETSSTTMTFALYELALHQDIQDRARAEIEEVLEKHGGKYTYEAMLDMPYVDQIINESLRKYPPIGVLFRAVSKAYDVPELQHKLAVGSTIWIPVYALHHDEQYFPNPDRFDPERFTPENIQSRDSMTFLPFGDGPRNCIGLRFGMMQVRIGLVTLLQHFKFTTSSKTPIPMVFSNKDFVIAPKGGLWLDVNKI